MPKLIKSTSVFNGIVRVPEDGDDAYVETIESPLQILLNKTAFLYDQLQELTAIVSAMSVVREPPPLEAVPLKPLEPRHLKITTTNLEDGRDVIVHLAAFSVAEPDRRPIYVKEYSSTFSMKAGEVKKFDNLPAELYYSINFNAGYGFFNNDVYYPVGVSHPLFKIGRISPNTEKEPYVHTFEVQRAASNKPVELQLTRVAPNQIFLLEIYRDMNTGDDTNIPRIATRVERTSPEGTTSINLGNFDGGIYWINLDGTGAKFSDSGKISTAFNVGLEGSPMVIGIEGIA